MKLLILGVIAIVMLGVASGACRQWHDQQWKDEVRERAIEAREAAREAREAVREAAREVREARREAARARRDWGYTY
jgi:hypothetical protein